MKAWELMYDKEVLKEGKNIVDDVKIINNDDDEIIGEIEGFEVSTYIEYNSPSYVSCNCSKQMPCKHEASFIYHLEKYSDLFVKKIGLKERLDLIQHKELKKFILNELENNNDFKTRFLEEFKLNSLIDKDYYNNKLSIIFKQGESKDFEYHGIYNLELMESSLKDFLMEDINSILVAGEYDFACDLLCRIGDLLDNELMTSHDSWYDLSDSFMHYVHSLSNSIHLDSEKMNELYSKTDLITDIITIF